MEPMQRKKLLFMSRHAPYGSSLAKDALDALLAASAYDQQLSLLFMDDGVFQLMAQQEPSHIEQKSFSAILPVLELYEINSIYVHLESLEQRQISTEELAIASIQILNSAAIGELLKQQDHLLSF
jgi:tRNA 2-thiouridine synthesizing protein C